MFAATKVLAVMCDTLHPRKLTTLARVLDEPAHAFSWREVAAAT